MRNESSLAVNQFEKWNRDWNLMVSKYFTALSFGPGIGFWRSSNLLSGGGVSKRQEVGTKQLSGALESRVYECTS